MEAQLKAVRTNIWALRLKFPVDEAPSGSLGPDVTSGTEGELTLVVNCGDRSGHLICSRSALQQLPTIAPATLALPHGQ